MPFVLSPEILFCPNCQGCDIEFCSASGTGFQCRTCGRVMEQHGPVIDMLPPALSDKTSMNLAHYEAMASSGDSLLDRRGKSRNHRIKFTTISELLGLNGDGPRKSVMELGAGAGTHGAEFARLGHHYVGLDISPAALYGAARANPVLDDAVLIVGDATRIPLSDNLFDTVFCVATLHHLPEPVDGLREMIRVLKPGGKFCFMEPRWYYPTQLHSYFSHPDVEVSTFKIQAHRLLRSLRECHVQEAHVKCCVFTPNRPAFLHGVYRQIDRLFAAIPPLHIFSVVRCIYGTK